MFLLTDCEITLSMPTRKSPAYALVRSRRARDVESAQPPEGGRSLSRSLIRAGLFLAAGTICIVFILLLEVDRNIIHSKPVPNPATAEAKAAAAEVGYPAAASAIKLPSPPPPSPVSPSPPPPPPSPLPPPPPAPQPPPAPEPPPPPPPPPPPRPPFSRRLPCASWCHPHQDHCNWEEEHARCACSGCSYCEAERAAASLDVGANAFGACPEDEGGAVDLSVPDPLPAPPALRCERREAEGAGYVHVRAGVLTRRGKPYRFFGANLWFGASLGAKRSGARARLGRELDRLVALGVTNVRVMASSEGAGDEVVGADGSWSEPKGPHAASASTRVLPSMQPRVRAMNADVLEGLDYLLTELGRRDMTAVLTLSNMWLWSGGLAQYVGWATGETPPLMRPDSSDWDAFQRFTIRFYSLPAAKAMYYDFVRAVVGRVNSISGARYADDPAIMAWQLANEPRPLTNGAAYRLWIREAAALIRSLDCRHLISLGSEGRTPFQSYVGNQIPEDHEHVDYVTAHIWPQNWKWYDSKRQDVGYAFGKAAAYLADAVGVADALGKPLVVEEFGLARDDMSYAADATTARRDDFYRRLCRAFADAPPRVAAGLNFWGWAGEGRPREPGGIWRPGDALIADPPHEYQGWYSVYDVDKGTGAIIKECVGLLTADTGA